MDRGLRQFFDAHPLRWYPVVLLAGVGVSLAAGSPLQKFQQQRWVEILLAVAVLAWCYRPAAARLLGRPLLSGWYGLGLIGFGGVALVGSALGPIPWISLGFVGVVLLQFGLLPLLVDGWRERRDEGIRLLALLAVALVGMDVGLWLVMHGFDLQPYAWMRRLSPSGQLEMETPYLFLNARWANQVSLLLLWTFIPLLQQLQQGVIRRQRRFWWFVCWAVPLLCCTQVVLSEGDGALIAILLALVGLLVQRRNVRAVQILACCLAAAFALSLLLNEGTLLLQFGQRAGTELQQSLTAPPKGATLPTVYRLPYWLLYLRHVADAPLFGHGIPVIQAGSPVCTPHNIWVALLYWTGLAGTGFALLLTTGFVPWSRQQWRQASPMAMPLLVSLFVYQLVDDIWLRPLSLALLLVLLASLLPADAPPLPEPAMVRRFTLCFEQYRLLALLGVLLLCLSVAMPGGAGLGPSDLVSLPGQMCLLLF